MSEKFDVNRLQRNYFENPLKHGEYMCKDDFVYLYIEQNLSRSELASLFNLSVVKISRHQKLYNIKKDVDSYIKNTHRRCLEKYGVKHTSQLQAVKNKIKQTTKERYGRDYIFQKHISSETLDIMHNKDKLEQYIIENGVLNGVDLANRLNVNSSGIERRVKEYGLSHLFVNTFSIPEKYVRDYVNQYYETENNTKILDGKEIDIFIPQLNLGIEFNGNYWHSEFKKDSKYHQEKSMIAESKGLFIYHIFEYEWLLKKDKIINQLNNLLGINQTKIYARKCVIKEVDNKSKAEFLELNHLQGNDSSSIKLGLYYNNELVSLMTFCKPRFNKKYEWELSRFCSKAGCNVIGGASKLFKHFANNYQPNSIISYSNIAHTKGNLYGMLGFELNGISSPNYVWYKSGDIKSRYQCQKSVLIKQGFEGDTEEDIMKDQNYYRIYDCGNKVWIWKKGAI